MSPCRPAAKRTGCCELHLAQGEVASARLTGPGSAHPPLLRTQGPARGAPAHLALPQALQGLLESLRGLLGRQLQDALGHGAAEPPGTRLPSAPSPRNSRPEAPARHPGNSARPQALTSPQPAAAASPGRPEITVRVPQCADTWDRSVWGAGQCGVQHVGQRAVQIRGMQGSLGCRHTARRVVWVQAVRGADTWGAGWCGVQGSLEHRAALGAGCCGMQAAWGAGTWGAGWCEVQARGAGSWGGDGDARHKVPIQGHPIAAVSGPHEHHPRGARIPWTKPLNSGGHKGWPWVHEEV